MSFKDGSVKEFTKDWVIKNPILYDGTLKYLSSIKVSAVFLTKNPFIKYTPSSIVTAEPWPATGRSAFKAVASTCNPPVRVVPLDRTQVIVSFAVNLATLFVVSEP